MTVHMSTRESDDIQALAIDLETVLMRHAPLISHQEMVAVLAQYIGAIGKSLTCEPQEFEALVNVNMCLGRDA